MKSPRKPQPRKPRLSNPYNKERKPGNPYAIFEQGGWKWKLLKLWQRPDLALANPYARAFCMVESPIVPDGEMGDVYVVDIPGCKDWLRSLMAKTYHVTFACRHHRDFHAADATHAPRVGGKQVCTTCSRLRLVKTVEETKKEVAGERPRVPASPKQ